MKYLLATLIFLNAFKSSGQLSGNYCYVDYYSAYYCIDFLSTDSFSYYESGCTLTKEGIGKYSIVKDTLTLLFATDYKKIGVQSTSSKTDSNLTDSITLKMHVLDALDDEPLPYVNIVAKDSELRIRGGGQTNQNGEVTFKFPVNDSISQLNISYIGYSPICLDISSNLNQDIQIKIASDQTIESGTEWKYEIKSSNRRFLLIRRLPNEFQSGFDKYKKTDANKG